MEHTKANRAAVRIWVDGERYAAVGVFTETEGRCALTYAEPGLDGSLTHLVFDCDSARMERSGAYQAVMEFAEGKAFSCEYGTPFGTSQLSVRTESFSAVKTVDGWRMDLVYAVRWDGGAWEPHELNLAVSI